MARYDINIYNAKIDRTNTVMRTGKNGILYEYILPYGGNPNHYYEDAIDVKSHKSINTRYDNGKRPGEYQPVGDKRYFTFYQLKKMLNMDAWNNFIEDLIRRQDEIELKKWEDAVLRGVFNGS